jgi:hypothetical protein
MQTMTKTNYQALLERIKSANTEAELIHRENQITRHYNAGTISVLEFMRLDSKIMDKLANLEEVDA